MTLKINYLDTKKILSKNTAVFLCRDAKISDNIFLKINFFIEIYNFDTYIRFNLYYI